MSIVLGSLNIICTYLEIKIFEFSGFFLAAADNQQSRQYYRKFKVAKYYFRKQSTTLQADHY